MAETTPTPDISHQSSPHARNRRPLLPDFILPKLFHIPLLPLDSPRQHCKYFIHQKRPCGRTPPARRHPEPQPLHPLAKVMRIQHVSEQPRLGDLVMLLHAALGTLLFVTDAVLALLLPAADVTQLIVVEEVGREAEVEDDDSE